jgi:hypothetical protein
MHTCTQASMQALEVMNRGADEEKAESARLVRPESVSSSLSISLTLLHSFAQSAFVGAIAVGDLVKSTLGPKGMVCVVFACKSFRFCAFNITLYVSCMTSLTRIYHAG